MWAGLIFDVFQKFKPPDLVDFFPRALQRSFEIIFLKAFSSPRRANALFPKPLWSLLHLKVFSWSFLKKVLQYGFTLLSLTLDVTVNHLEGA